MCYKLKLHQSLLSAIDLLNHWTSKDKVVLFVYNLLFPTTFICEKQKRVNCTNHDCSKDIAQPLKRLISASKFRLSLHGGHIYHWEDSDQEIIVNTCQLSRLLSLLTKVSKFSAGIKNNVQKVLILIGIYCSDLHS